MGALLALVPFRFWLIGAAVLAAVTAGGLYIHSVKQQAAADAIAVIERANNAAREKADAGEDKVNACYHGNPPGHWDRFEQLCKHP